jgi:hypothetical protein
MSPIGKIDEITAKPSSQVQIDTKQNPQPGQISGRRGSQSLQSVIQAMNDFAAA